MDMECHIPKMFEEGKAMIKEDTCMKFYDETKLLYTETDAFLVGLGAALLQTRDITEMKHQITASSDPHYLPSRASLMQRRDAAILKEKHCTYCMALKSPIIISLSGRYA